MRTLRSARSPLPSFLSASSPAPRSAHALSVGSQGTWRPPSLPLGAVEIPPASSVGLRLKLPHIPGFDTDAAQGAGAPAKGKSGAAAPAKKPPAAPAPANGAVTPRELPTPMQGEDPTEQLLAKTGALLVLADQLEQAAAAEEEALAAQAAEEAAAEGGGAGAEQRAAVRALHSGLLAFWRAEAAKLRRRTRALCVHGAAALSSAQCSLEAAYGRLHAALGRRVTAELEVREAAAAQQCARPRAACMLRSAPPPHSARPPPTFPRARRSALCCG